MAPKRRLGNDDRAMMPGLRSGCYIDIDKTKPGVVGEIMKEKTQGPAARNGSRGRLSGDPLGANSEIGRKLRQYYDDLVSDEVPDRFTQLLAQLEQTEPPVKKG